MSNNEKKVVGASYIVNFFETISNLNHYFCQYSNLLLEIKTKYSCEDEIVLKNFDDEDKNMLINMVQTLRYYSKMFYIQYNSLFKALKLEEDKQIKTIYGAIAKSYIPVEDNVFKYVTIANSILLNDVVKDLLVSSQSLFSGIYDNGKTTETSK